MSREADSELSCAVEVLAATGAEAANATALSAAEETAQGNDLQSLSMDSLGLRGEVLYELREAEAGPHLTVYVPPYPWSGAAPELFTPEDLHLAETGAAVRCPGGQTTRRRYRAARQHGWPLHFSPAPCAPCPLRAQCLTPTPPRGRTVSKHDSEAQYRTASARAQTDDYRQVRRPHPRIERKLADLVRGHGGRHARYRGRGRVKIQYLLTAVVVNLTRSVNLLGSPLPLQPAGA